MIIYYYNKINKILTNYKGLGGDFIANKGIENHNPSNDYDDEEYEEYDDEEDEEYDDEYDDYEDEYEEDDE